MAGTIGQQGRIWPDLSIVPTMRIMKTDDDFDIVLPKACCGPIQIIWWYKSIGSDDYGIHVNWGKWEDEYNKLKLISNETLSYFHEYFHHVCDTWKTKHGLRDEALAREYERIWTNEDQKKEGYTEGILLGEALAEWFAEKRQESIQFIKKKQHPSYSVQTFGGYWEWCSLFHVYQILNKKYEIFKQPMDPVVADRRLISDLNKDYEEFEDELYSVSMGFCLDDSVYEYAKDSPQTIPFYVHGQGQKENWGTEVQEFCKQNNLAKPIFVH
jgi:hypothetical protein